MSTAAEQIRAEIGQHGAISFARFMELALYCPLCGYYEKKEDTTGKRGDYYTSVSVGPLFGELLAFQFAEWFEQSEVQNLPPEVGGVTETMLQIVEVGAHDGRLAVDILNWFSRQRPQLFERVGYVILEPSPRRQTWQREALSPFTPHVRWLEDLPVQGSRLEIQDSRPLTLFFSNELLDAFPVHRLGWNAKLKQWFEWGVTLDGLKLGWTRLPLTSPLSRLTPQLPAELLAVLPDGFTTEICSAAEDWWRRAAEWLPCGKLIAFDYGLEAEEFFSPGRADGTLRGYRGHKLSRDLLATPGDQDLTAHVNFTAIRRTGEAAGLQTETETAQSSFVTGIAQRAWRENSGFGPWTTEHTRQFQTLTHPDFLGRAFRVLIQGR